MKGLELNDDLILRRAAPGDSAALARLAQAAYGPYVPILNAVPRPAEANYDQIAVEDEVWITGRCEHPIASLVLRIKTDHLLIWSIAVNPTHQKQGLGKLLLNFSLQRARQENLCEVRLVTNALMTHNRAWYARNGFAEIRHERLDDRTAIHMSLALNKE